MPGQHGSGCNCGEEESAQINRSLLSFIDLDGVRGMNEEIPRSAAKIFKVFEKRLDDSESCRSVKGDPELLIHVPFTTPCKLTGIKVIGGDDGKHPVSVQLFANNETLDFSSIQEVQATQSIDLIEDFCGVLEYPLKANKFPSTTYLSLYFPNSFNEELTELFYIGTKISANTYNETSSKPIWSDIRGIATNYKRTPVVTIYETRANRADHPIYEQYQPPLGF